MSCGKETDAHKVQVAKHCIGSIPTPHALFLEVCNSSGTQGWKKAWNILLCFYVMLWPRWLVTGLTLRRPRFIQSQSTLDVWWETALFFSE